jgi:hypothetical protein
MSKRAEQVEQSNAHFLGKKLIEMVPVVSENNKILFPCKERRARRLMERDEAKPHFRHGIFCIKLIRKETERREEYPAVALGVDPGSKREGYTVATTKSVVLNITTNTPDWVKDHVETRRRLRRSRRYRKTPYRQMKSNRSILKATNRIPPSTLARWNAKLRLIKQLLKILPITIINVEDIKATTKKGKKWNLSFSPLEVGKSWFYSELEKLGVKLVKTQGYATKQHRDQRGFKKSKTKLDYRWEAHNVDSHSLCEMALGTSIKPYHGLYKTEFLEYHRRQLHIQNPIKGKVRKQYGGTVSLGISRGSVLKHKDKLCYLGGTSRGKVSIHSIITGKRINQNTNTRDIKVMYNNKQRTQFLPWSKPWVSLRNFS